MPFWKQIKHASYEFLADLKIIKAPDTLATHARITSHFLIEFNLGDKYDKYQLGFNVLGVGKLNRIYDWRKGDFPNVDDHIQWLILLDYQRTMDEVTRTADFKKLWNKTPDKTKRKLLSFYLAKEQPWSNYCWRPDIRKDDLSIFDNRDDTLVALYPYIFHRNDVHFLFDSEIPKPGSGLQGAWDIDVTKAWAIWEHRDICDEDEFKKATSNVKPLHPEFVFSYDIYKVKLPAADFSTITPPEVYSTEFVSKIEVSGETMAVDPKVLEKIAQINRRAQSNVSMVPSSSNQSWKQPQAEMPNALPALKPFTHCEIITDDANSPLHKVNTDAQNQKLQAVIKFTDSIKTAIPISLKSIDSAVPSIVPLQPLINSPQSTALHSIETRKETTIDQRNFSKLVEPTLNEATMPVTYWQKQNESFQKQKQKSFSTNLDDHVPNIPPPQDGERVLIGTGWTQRLLGQGGQGRVYESYSDELEMSLAVKICFPPPWITDVNQILQQKNKFMREIKIQANLHHTNIVQIFTYGEWNKYPFVEMEFVKGADVSKLLQKYGRIDHVVVLALAVQMLSSLNYAHTRTYTIDQKEYEGIIHRDIKPGNVIVSADGYVKLLDFGIALPFGMISMTVQMGNIVGTIPYASPEQLSGKNLDPRSDIYSIGVLLYEMLIGKPAFGHGASLQDVINNVISGNYKKIDDFNLKIPKSVKRIINYAMQKDPNRRFESSAVMLNVCLQALHELTREMPESIVKEFVSGQDFRDITASYHIPPNMLPKKKKKFFFSGPTGL